MSYVIMTLTVLCGCIKGGCGKKISGYADTNDKAVLFNSIRMLLRIAIGAVMVLAQGGRSVHRLPLPSPPRTGIAEKTAALSGDHGGLSVRGRIPANGGYGTA